ncbi:MAG: glycerate dehydrogenase [Dehalococcoidia bacterium]|nr:glycerate dehydrogenase [Dehalococcoidia bacterium]MDW8119202.1 NAD(P)-dependent oxidoreductase [Chloroflexota bacterium]
MPLVVIPDNIGYPKDLPAHLTEGLGEVRHYNDLPTPEEFIRRAREADALIWAWVKLTPALLDALPRLRVASYMGVGVGNYIDLDHATRRGITVCNTPHYGDDAVAEFTFALILALARKVVEADRSLREGRWEQEALAGLGLRGKTLGIVGLGGVGSQVARLGRAFGMRVLCFTARPSPQRAQEHEVEFVSLQTLLREADVVTLHCALTPQTRGLIGTRELAMMKPTAFLVNMARAEVVDTDALATALREGRIAGAAIDVWEEEPPPRKHPLLLAPRTLLTPHLGWNADTAKWRMLEIALGNIRAFFAGRPQNVVNQPQQ